MENPRRTFPRRSGDLGKRELYLFGWNAAECKYGRSVKGKIFFPPRDTEVDYRFVTEWLFTQEASSWLNTRPMAEH